MMKKRLSIVLIGLIAAAAAVSALSGLPHAHGTDTDHSQHKSCVFYKASFLTFLLHTATPFQFHEGFSNSAMPAPDMVFHPQEYLLTYSLRAPPIR